MCGIGKGSYAGNFNLPKCTVMLPLLKFFIIGIQFLSFASVVALRKSEPEHFHQQKVITGKVKNEKDNRLKDAADQICHYFGCCGCSLYFCFLITKISACLGMYLLPECPVATAPLKTLDRLDYIGNTGFRNETTY